MSDVPATDILDSLALLDRARDALARAETLADIGAIRETAERARKYASAAKLGLEAENHAAKLRVEAERKAGALLADMERRRPEEGRPEASDDPTHTKPTLSDLGISRQQSSDWQRMASVPDEDVEQWTEEKAAHGEKITTSGLVGVAKSREPVRSAPSPDFEDGPDPFICPECGGEFTLRVWHCPACDHHWPDFGSACKNCLSVNRFEYPPGFTADPDDEYAGIPSVERPGDRPSADEAISLDAVADERDDDGAVAKARLLAQYSTGIAAACNLAFLDTRAVVGVLGRERRLIARENARTLRAWLDRLDRDLDLAEGSPLQLVGGHGG